MFLLYSFDVSLQVDTINSVQFSNHTGYPAGIRGQVLEAEQLQELIDGLDANKINHYSHIINGYIGSKSFLTKLSEVISHLKTVNPSLIYVCDPVMGDIGPGLYVPKVGQVDSWISSILSTILLLFCKST